MVPFCQQGNPAIGITQPNVILPKWERNMSILRQIAQLGRPVLRQAAQHIAEPGDPAVQALIDDMLATVVEVNGVGIAAPQVYEPLRIFIVASHPNPRYPHAPEMEPTAIINPEIIWSSDEIEKGWEGCLSIPGIRGFVPRSTGIRVRYLTRAGLDREQEFTGFIARVFQHENDHLNGIVFLDRLESTGDIISEKEYIRIMTGT
jgi:peptide deformylase